MDNQLSKDRILAIKTLSELHSTLLSSSVGSTLYVNTLAEVELAKGAITLLGLEDKKLKVFYIQE